jgi:hypothetical protein
MIVLEWVFSLRRLFEVLTMWFGFVSPPMWFSLFVGREFRDLLFIIFYTFSYSWGLSLGICWKGNAAFIPISCALFCGKQQNSDIFRVYMNLYSILIFVVLPPAGIHTYTYAYVGVLLLFIGCLHNQQL